MLYSSVVWASVLSFAAWITIPELLEDAILFILLYAFGGLLPALAAVSIGVMFRNALHSDRVLALNDGKSEGN